jgi:hypothetical protein
MSMILLEPAYKISRSEIKRRTISVTPYCGSDDVLSGDLGIISRRRLEIIGVP